MQSRSRNFHQLLVFVLWAASVAFTPAHAAGFYLTEVGTPGSLGTAGVGNPTSRRGADTAWTNPAGMTAINETQFVMGSTVLLPKINFDPSIAGAGGNDGDNAGKVALIPGAFYVRPLNDRLRLGFALTAPQGGGFDFGSQFAGRYTLTSLQLTGIGVSSSLGYQVTDELSVGAGLTMVYSNFEQDIALNQGPLPDGRIKIEDADDFGFQPYFGVQWQATERLQLGAVYRTEFDANLKGDIQVRNLLTRFNPSGSVKVEWTNPQWLDVGLRFKARDDLELMVSGGWQEWSEFGTNRLSVGLGPGTVQVLDRNFDDTWYLGGAVQWRMDERSLLSFGIKYDSSPVSDGNRTLDLPFDETWTFSANLARPGDGNFDYALGATLMYAGDGNVDQVSQGVRIKGDFSSNLLLFLGGTMQYRFD